MIDVPKSNPILFRPLTGQTSPNFDNTFTDDYTGENRTIRKFSQVCAEDGWQIQVVTDYNAWLDDTNCDIKIIERIAGVDTVIGDPPTMTQLGGLYYYTFSIAPVSTGCFKLWVLLNEDTEYTHESEWIYIHAAGIEDTQAENANLFRLEWFNLENGFSLDYVVSGFVGQAHIEGKLILGQPAGDVTVFDNQGEEIKLKEIVQRVMMFTAEVPDYLAEQLILWMAHDEFMINDVKYVTSKKPTIEQKGNSNIYLITAELHQFSVLGINTHDVGFDCDAATLNTMILNQTEVAKTASFTVEAPAGYMLHTVTLVRNTGSAGIELGITATGDEVFTSTTIDGTDALVTVQTHYALATATTLYFTVTGTVNFDVNLQYILNPLS